MTDPMMILSRTIHDLRNPLSSIIGYGELLEEIQTSEEGKGHARLINRKSREMSALMEAVADVLHWQIQNQAPVLNPKNHDLRQLAESAALNLRGDFPKTNWVWEAGAPEPVFCDKNKTLRLLTALFKNACTFGGPNPVITLIFSGNPETASLEIIDQGPGLPPDIVKNFGECFSPGMGLAWAKTLAVTQNGSLEIGPQTPGCRLTLNLPR